MLNQIYDKLSDPATVVALLVAIAVIATILTIAMPLLDSDSLAKRMKSVASEREKIRARERERLAAPLMAGSRDVLPDRHRAHVHEVREGARGATTVQGGGCGCN